jgi:hypothetical protein
MTFDKEYYESNNYTNYLARQDRYIRLAEEVVDYLKKMNLVQSPILDFGCAVGFLLEGLKKHGDCYGVEISEWAIEEATKRGHDVRREIMDVNHGLVFALDVFEHMPEGELTKFFYKLDANAIVFRMPICANSGEDYVLECSRVDPTHLIRWTKEEWKKFFNSHGYITTDLQLSTIYNSEGVYAGLALRNQCF